MSDMERFVSVHLGAMESAPHIYLSALAWQPEETLAYETLSKAFVHLPIVANKEPIGKGARVTVTKESDIYVKSVAYAPAGYYYALRRERTVQGDDEIHVWDSRTNSLVLRANLISSSSSSLRYLLVFSLDGRWLASNSSDDSICIWTLATGQIRKTLMPRSDPDCRYSSVTSLAFSLDGTRIASAQTNGWILIWEVESGNMVFRQNVCHDFSAIECTYIAFSSDGKHILSGSNSLQIMGLDTDTCTSIRTLPVCDPNSERVSRFAWSRDEKFIAVVVSDRFSRSRPKCTVKLWNVRTYEAIGELEDLEDSACLSFTEDSEQIYSCSNSGSISVWSIDSLELIKTMDLGIDICCASFSPDLKRILTHAEDRVSIFDIQFGVAEEAPNISLDVAYDVAVSSDSRYIASCHGKSDCIYVWDAATGEAVLEPLQGHSDDVRCVTFSNDGRWLVSGSADHSVRIWDVFFGLDLWRATAGTHRPGNICRYLAGQQASCVMLSGHDSSYLGNLDTIAGWNFRRYILGVLFSWRSLACYSVLELRGMQI